MLTAVPDSRFRQCGGNESLKINEDMPSHITHFTAYVFSGNNVRKQILNGGYDEKTKS